ncbi:hypothetical protein THIOSC13_220057 [uncultured Thiomicrorhabdus sp.]
MLDNLAFVESLKGIKLSECGAIDGDRTRDNRNHNPGLYQLSYNRRSNLIDPPFNGTPIRIRT